MRMRRSGAPSQLYGSTAKKPRFVPPGPTHINQPRGLQKTSQPPHLVQCNTLNEVEKVLSENKSEGPSLSKALARILNAVPKQDVKENHTGVQEVSQIYSEDVKTTVDRTATGAPPVSMPPVVQALPLSRGLEETAPNARYFSVMWCKASKKKHKRWEGDAVLVARGRTVLLKDMEGRDIGRGSGYKCSELESLAEGQSLMVGGKEVEVMAVISEEEFCSGRCFQEARADAHMPASPAPAAPKPLSRPFTKPGSKGMALSAEGPVCHPRHDPQAPGALVMPRPTENHQWEFNRAGLPMVDVVVDPYLTTHLRPHQREGVLFLYECIMGMRGPGRYGAILADEMGLGKTLQCIALVWTLLRQGPYGGRPVARRVLVVTPGSLVKNWVAEFDKWLGRERMTVFAVDQDHRVEEFAASPRSAVLVISYEMLLRTVEQVVQLEFGLIICDEGHRLKNSSIKTSAALSGLSCVRRVILTGTPVQNDLQEFYAIIEFVNPGILGSSSAYRKVYEEPIVRSRQPGSNEEERRLGEERAADLSRLTGLFVLRRTQEIIDRYLPPKLEWTVFCRPAPLQLEVYRRLLAHHVVRACLQGVLENSPHLVCIGALKKLCNHPGLLYTTIQEKGALCAEDCSLAETSLYQDLAKLFPEAYSSGAFSTTDSGKLLVLVDLLAAVRQLGPSDRVVLVSNYTQTLDLLQDLCVHLGYSCCRLDGKTPVSQRQKLVDRFNSRFSTDFIFLLSSKAGGVGLNLVGASHLILYDIDWNPANDIQAMARVWRDGQRKTVHIYRFLTAGTIEEKIFQRQVSKQGLSGAVVDASRRADHTSFSTEELRDLFTLHEDSRCVTHELLGCGCTGDGSVPGVVNEESPAEERPCQLGQHSYRASATKCLTMSELMHWGHYSGEHPSFSDPYLDQAREHVTFAFLSTTSNLPPQLV